MEAEICRCVALPHAVRHRRGNARKGIAYRHETLSNSHPGVDGPAGAADANDSVCDGPVLTNHFFRWVIKPENYLRSMQRSRLSQSPELGNM
jgi:hypothetical protein